MATLEAEPDVLSDRGAPAPRPTPRWVYAAAFALYLLCGIVVFLGVWTTHPSSVTTCGCGDTSLILWFIEWPAYALAHGLNPLYSTALFHPHGVNLLANTSSLAIGIPLAPVTWLFGPVASLNVAMTVSPALSAISMFWLLRRWQVWIPAALLGGLVFGFSPFVIVNLAGSHLMLGALCLLPLLVACFDELLIRQRHGAVAVGAALGAIVAVQYFVGTEILAIAALMGTLGLVLIVIYAALFERARLVENAEHAAIGLGTGGVVALVLLAYPVWFTLKGPAHLSGLIWPTIPTAYDGIVLHNLWQGTYETQLRTEMLHTGGYLGPALAQPEFLGLGLLLVLGLGVLWRWRDRRLWLFGSLGAVSVLLSLGLKSLWTPWRLFAELPLIENIIPARFAAITSLCAAILLALILDALWTASLPGLAERPARHASPASSAGRAAPIRAALVLLVAAVAVVPIGRALRSNVPLATRAVSVPTWFATVAPHLPPGQVILTFPSPLAIEQSAEDWAAVDKMSFALVGGSGPEAIPERAGSEARGQAVVVSSSFSLSGPPAPSNANIQALRSALAGWGVTLVVQVDPATVPLYERSTNPAATLALMTLAIGRAPVYRDGAWVFTHVSHLSPALAITQDQFDACTSPSEASNANKLSVPTCVLATSTYAP